MASVITIGLTVWFGYSYWPLINAVLCAAMTPYVVLGLSVVLSIMILTYAHNVSRPTLPIGPDTEGLLPLYTKHRTYKTRGRALLPHNTMDNQPVLSGLAEVKFNKGK